LPHSSQSTAAIEENGAPHAVQRRSMTPPHCGQASGTSASNSSNHRSAAPHVTQNATQSPSTLRRSSRSQSAALPMLITVIVLTGCGGPAYRSTDGARIDRFTLHSAFLRRDLHEILVVPRRHDPHRWLLVLLHGRGAGPMQFLMQPFFDELAALGTRAPYVLLLDGGDHSYWHDRKDGQWAKEVLDEGIPAGVARAAATRIALGGISMGGYGALLLGVGGRWCAVGAHSPAVWEHAADTAPGAFDDAADFGRNDIFARTPAYGRTPIWIDVGTRDPFHDAAVAYARKVHAQLHVWPGGHETSYWRSHMRSYLRFYASACG
jgi:enterochelin esterase-like enzyme